jgi:FKBP-type peptidyl-prolyl cis-trans isomerase
MTLASFVSTRGRYEPERFGLDRQSGRRPIEGIARAHVGLAQGTRVRIHVPGHLAYGAEGVPGLSIDPNADLLFDDPQAIPNARAWAARRRAAVQHVHAL